MSIKLTESQQQILDSEREQPPRVVDPRTNAAYVLLPADQYESVREILDEAALRQAIHAVALQNAADRMDESA